MRQKIETMLLLLLPIGVFTLFAATALNNAVIAMAAAVMITASMTSLLIEDKQ